MKSQVDWIKLFEEISPHRRTEHNILLLLSHIYFMHESDYDTEGKYRIKHCLRHLLTPGCIALLWDYCQLPSCFERAQRLMFRIFRDERCLETIILE